MARRGNVLHAHQENEDRPVPRLATSAGGAGDEPPGGELVFQIITGTGREITIPIGRIDDVNTFIRNTSIDSRITLGELFALTRR